MSINENAFWLGIRYYEEFGNPTGTERDFDMMYMWDDGTMFEWDQLGLEDREPVRNHNENTFVEFLGRIDDVAPWKTDFGCFCQANPNVP